MITQKKCNNRKKIKQFLRKFKKKKKSSEQREEEAGSKLKPEIAALERLKKEDRFEFRASLGY